MPRKEIKTPQHKQLARTPKASPAAKQARDNKHTPAPQIQQAARSPRGAAPPLHLPRDGSAKAPASNPRPPHSGSSEKGSQLQLAEEVVRGQPFVMTPHQIHPRSEETDALLLHKLPRGPRPPLVCQNSARARGRAIGRRRAGGRRPNANDNERYVGSTHSALARRPTRRRMIAFDWLGVGQSGGRGAKKEKLES